MCHRCRDTTPDNWGFTESDYYWIDQRRAAMEFAVTREMENDMTKNNLPTPDTMRRQMDEMAARGRKAIFGEDTSAPVTRKPRPSGMPKRDKKPSHISTEPHLSYKPFRGLDQMIIAAFAEGRWT